MPEEFEGVFDVEIKARKLRNGHRMQIILERPYDPEEFAHLAQFQFEQAEVSLAYHEVQQDLEFDEEYDDEMQEDLIAEEG